MFKEEFIYTGFLESTYLQLNSVTVRRFKFVKFFTIIQLPELFTSNFMI